MPLYSSPIFVNLTKRCNFFCKYCFNNSSSNNESSSFVTGNWNTIISQIKKTSINEIRFSGGEPLMVNNIHNICQSIDENNMTYTLTTNGSLLYKNLQWMRTTPPSTLWISYHEEYNTFNSFENLLSTINLHQTKIGVNIFLEDLSNDSKLFSLFSNPIISRFKILYKTPLGRANKNQLIYSFLDYEKLIKNAIGNHNPEVRIESPLLNTREKGLNSCVLNRRPLITLDDNGEIYSCCIAINDSSSSIGSLLNDSLEDILYNYSNNHRRLPCRNVLPNIQRGTDTCPLNLINFKMHYDRS